MSGTSSGGSLMYVWAVSYIEDNDIKPTVNVFKYKEAATSCYEEMAKKHNHVSLDKCPVYRHFYVVDDTQQIYLR